MLKISYVGCLGLSPTISAQFILIMCAATKNHCKFFKITYFAVEGRSTSFMLVQEDRSLAVLMISSKFVPIDRSTTVFLGIYESISVK